MINKHFCLGSSCPSFQDRLELPLGVFPALLDSLWYNVFFHFRCSLERNVPPIESAMSRINFLGFPYLEHASRNLSWVIFLLDTLLHPHSILKPHSYLFCLLLPPPAHLFELKTAATETSRDHSVSKSTKICKSVVLKWHHFDCITA